MVKDDVRIELSTHRGLLCVNPMHRILPEKMTPTIEYEDGHVENDQR